MQERAGSLADALNAYRQAKKLDSQWQDAGRAVNRMLSQIKQQRFSDAMSVAFNDLAKKNYRTAREGFASAQDILPDSREPADGLLQVDQAERSDAIAHHRKRANESLASDDWAGAIEEFEAALAIDPSLVFAGEGVTYAAMRLDLDDKLKRYLSEPSLLQDDKALKDAKKTLVSVSRVEPKSTTTSTYMDTLARLISGARIKIPVTIRSDNKTDVTVLRISRLGMIDSTVLDLIPGRYTITGKRNGYRDVRRDLTVVSGETVPTISISCTERI